MKRTIIPGTIPTGDFHQYLLGAVAPRPIAFVSTIDEQGRTNLAPYSFFNAFSSNPPILVFSSNRRVDGNTTKDTLHNIQVSMECVVNVVNYEIVRQMMVCSVDFPNDISEFEQSGLTPQPASQVAPPLVKESPVNMECKVTDIITLGDKGGAGHLILCKVLCIHIKEEILDDNQRIDPNKIDLMGRMGRAFYVRASGAAILTMPQSQQLPIVGYPNLPEHIKSSSILTANVIGALSGMKHLPSKEQAIQTLQQYDDLKFIYSEDLIAIHNKALELFNNNQLDLTAAILMSH
ncbi:MAG: flavin reductase family protein [Saprospiraceae bacterium]|nr:flavin reductase family protein [Saprospiraceae bacterium]MBK9222670.1 flavin reductase family protein [Saprospiraceae bacterium]